MNPEQFEGLSEKDKEMMGIKPPAAESDSAKQERENLIQKEKEKILQELVEQFFKQLESFDANELDSISQTGLSAGGRRFESAFGQLNPESVKVLSQAFRQGVKLLSEILAQNPDLIKQFDEQLTEVAKKRLDQAQSEHKATESAASEPK